jgi:hypothetical protein
MGPIFPPPGAVASSLLVLVLVTASCDLGITGGLGSRSAGAGAPPPLSVGTQFLQTLVGGNADAAAGMLAVERRSAGTTKLLQDLTATLDGCTSSQAEFVSRVEEREPIVSVAFRPPCGNRKSLDPSYYGRHPGEPVASCEVGLEVVSSEWKPRSTTLRCKSP